MTDGDLHIEAGERGNEGSGSIAVDENNVGLHFFEDFADAFEDVDSNIKKGLLILHNGKVVIGRHVKGAEHLIEHLAMLAGDAEGNVEFGTLLQFKNEGTHFDRFRTGAENKHDFFHWDTPFLSFVIITIITVLFGFVNRFISQPILNKS